MKRILILEDNATILGHLTQIMQELNTRNIVLACNNVKDAYQCVMEKQIDLFIIDIILDTSCPGDTSGLDFVYHIRKITHYSFTPIIFITSLQDVRAHAYENLHCYSYIEKPFHVERVKELVEEALRFPGIIDSRKILYFRKEGIIISVAREEIVYVECVHHVMYIHTLKGDVLTLPYFTLKRLLKKIDSPDFIQCSRNTIVNKKYVYNVDLTNQAVRLKENWGSVQIGIKFKNDVKAQFL